MNLKKKEPSFSLTSLNYLQSIILQSIMKTFNVVLVESVDE